jgi:hypothetical protein
VAAAVAVLGIMEMEEPEGLEVEEPEGRQEPETLMPVVLEVPVVQPIQQVSMVMFPEEEGGVRKDQVAVV